MVEQARSGIQRCRLDLEVGSSTPKVLQLIRVICTECEGRKDSGGKAEEFRVVMAARGNCDREFFCIDVSFRNCGGKLHLAQHKHE